MDLLNPFRGKSKKNWRSRPNIPRSAQYVNTNPKVNKSRIVGISSAKPSPTQGLQNWFSRSFTKKQKPNGNKNVQKEGAKAPHRTMGKSVYRTLNLTNNPPGNAKPSPTQWLQNRFVRSFTKKQKPNRNKNVQKESVKTQQRTMYNGMNMSNNPFNKSNTEKELENLFGTTPMEQVPEPFDPVFPMPVPPTVSRKENNDPFVQPNTSKLKHNLNKLKSRQQNLKAQLKELETNPFTNNSNIAKIIKEIADFREQANSLHKRTRNLRNKIKGSK